MLLSDLTGLLAIYSCRRIRAKDPFTYKPPQIAGTYKHQIKYLPSQPHPLGPESPIAGGVVCTPGGRGPHVPALLEHSYCMPEGQLEVITLTEEVEPTTSGYQSSHSTLTTLLGHRLEEHTCTGLSIRLEVLGPQTLAHSLLREERSVQSAQLNDTSCNSITTPNILHCSGTPREGLSGWSARTRWLRWRPRKIYADE